MSKTFAKQSFFNDQLNHKTVNKKPAENPRQMGTLVEKLSNCGNIF